MTLSEILPVLCIGFVSSIISSSVGGGGFIVSTALVALGLPPQMAVGTSRFGGIGSLTTAIVVFSSGKKLDVNLGLKLAAVASIGAVVGMVLLVGLSNAIWVAFSMVNILIACVVLLLYPRLGIDSHTPRDSSWLGYVLYGFVGLWTGFFGGGGAILANIVLLVFFGQTFLESAGTRKIPALFVAILTFAISAWYGMVDWEKGLVLLVGMSLGSYFGARVILLLGDVWLRRFVLLFLLCSFMGLAWKLYNP